MSRRAGRAGEDGAGEGVQVVDAAAIEDAADLVDRIAGATVEALAEGDEAAAVAVLRALEARVVARIRAERARTPRLAPRTDAGRPRPLPGRG